MRVKELTEQNTTLKDELLEVHEDGKKVQWELIISRERCEEVEKLNSENKEMNENIVKKLTEEKEELDSEVQSLRKDLETLKMTNFDNDDDKMELIRELSQTKQDLLESAENCKSLQKENESLRQNLLVVTKRIESMEGECGEKEKDGLKKTTVLDKLERIREQLQGYHQNHAGLENEVQFYKEKLDFCNNELETKTRKMDEMKKSYDHLAKEKVKLEEELSQTQIDLEKLEMDLNHFEAENQLCKGQVEELEKQTCDLENDEPRRIEVISEETKRDLESWNNVSFLRQLIEDLEKELSLVSRKLSEAEAGLYNNQTQVQQLNLQLKESLDKVAELETCAGNKDTGGIGNSNAQLQQAKRQAQEARFQLRRKEKENKAFEEKFKETREEVHKMEIKTNLGETQRSKLTEQLQNEKGKFLKLQEDFKAFKKSMAENMSSLELNKQELSNKDAIIAEQKIKAADMELKYHDLSEQYNEIHDLHEQHKREIQEFENDLLQTKKDMADMQMKVSEAEDEKQKLKQEILTANKNISDLNSKLWSAEQGAEEKEREMSLMTQRLTKMKEDLEETSKCKSEVEHQLHESRSKTAIKGDGDNAMQKQIEELHSTCKGLRQQVAESELIIDQLKDENSSLETDISAVKKELSYSESLRETSAYELKRLATKLKSSEDEITRLTELSEKALQNKGTLEIELSVAHKKIESMEENMKENQETENSLVKSLQEERKQFVCKEADMVSYRSKIASLELQCDKLIKENDDLRRKNEELETKATALREQLDEVFKSRDQTIRRKMELEENVLEMQQDLEASIKCKTRHEEQAQNLYGKIANYETQIAELKRQNEELKEKIVAAGIEAANQKDELLKLEITATEQLKVRESAQLDLEQKKKDYDDMQKVIKRLQAELNEAKSDLFTSKMTHEFSLDEHSKLTRKVQEQETKLAQLEKQISDVNEENKRVKIELEAQAAKVNGLNIKLAAAGREKDRFKSERQSVEKKLQKIQDELHQAQNQVREKERIVQSYRIEIGEKDIQVEQLNGVKASYEEKNLALKKELQTTAFYYEASATKLKATQDELSCLKKKLEQFETTVNNLLQERDMREGNEDSLHPSNVLTEKNRERQATLEKEIAAHKAKISKLEHDLKMSRQDCLDSQTELSKCQRRLDDLKATHELSNMERRAQREEALEVGKKISDLEVKYENEMKINLALQNQLDEATKRRDSNRNEILKLSKQCVEQKIALDAAKKEIEQKNSEMEELKADKAHLEEKNAELRGHLTTAISESEKVRGGHQQLQDEIIVQQKSASNLSDQLQEAIEAKQAAQEELKLKDLEIESLNAEIEDVNNERDEIKEKEKQLQNALGKKHEELASSDKQLTDLHHELLRTKKELGGTHDDLKELKADNCALKEELGQNKDALKRLKVEFQSVQENVAVVDSSLLHSTIYDENAFGQEAELLQVKENLKQAEYNLQKSVERESALQDELECLKITAEQLRNDLQSLKEREDDLKEQGVEAEREVLNVRSDLKQSKEKLNKVASQLEMAQKKVDQLETQNNHLEGAKSLLMEELRDEREKTRKTEDELFAIQCKLQELQTKWDHLEKEAEDKETALDTAKSEKKCLEKDVQSLRDELSSTHALMNATLKKNREIDAENFHLKRKIADHEIKKSEPSREQDEPNKVTVEHQKMNSDLQQEIHKKQTVISALKAQLENMSQDLTNVTEKSEALINDLKGRVENVQKIASEKEARIVVLENAKAALEAEMKIETTKRMEIEDEFDKEKLRVNEIIQGKENQISELEYGVSKLKERMKKIQADQIGVKATCSEQASCLQDANKEIKKLSNELLSQGPVISTLKAKNVALDEERQRLKEDLNRLNRQFSEQTIQLDALKRENERLQGELNEASTPRSSPVKKLQMPFHNTVEPAFNNQKKLLEMESAYRDIILEKEGADEKNRSLKEKYEELDQKLNESLTTKDFLENDNVCKEKRIRELEDLLHQTEYSAQLERNELQAAVKAKSDMEMDLKSTREAISALEECNATYEETIKQMQESVEEAQEKSIQLENALEDGKRKLTSQMKQLLDMEKKVSDMENTKQSNAISNNQLTRDLQLSRNKITSLEDQLCTSARDQAKANLTVKEMNEKNAQLKKELQQLQSHLREESHDRELEKKDMRDKEEALKKIQRHNQELESEISEANKEMNEKTIELLTLMNTHEETQEELEAFKRQVCELETSWMQEKGENETLRLEMSASRKLYNDLKIAYDNLLDEINSSHEETHEKDLKKIVEIQRLTTEKEQLNKEIERLNKRMTTLKENNEKIQKDKKDVEQKLKMMQQRLLVLEADANTIDTIKTLQGELEESKKKINDLSDMYEAIKVERDNLRYERTKPVISPRPTSAYLDSLAHKGKTDDRASAQKDMLEAQERASLLGQKLKVARERLEGLKATPPNSPREAAIDSPEDEEDPAEVFCENLEEM